MKDKVSKKFQKQTRGNNISLNVDSITFHMVFSRHSTIDLLIIVFTFKCRYDLNQKLETILNTLSAYIFMILVVDLRSILFLYIKRREGKNGLSYVFGKYAFFSLKKLSMLGYFPSEKNAFNNTMKLYGSKHTSPSAYYKENHLAICFEVL